MDFEIWWLLAFAFVMTLLRGIYKLALAMIERRAPQALPAEMEKRIAKIEYATESTALEVERISESQRFLTRVLAARVEAEGVPAPAPHERVITPH